MIVIGPFQLKIFYDSMISYYPGPGVHHSHLNLARRKDPGTDIPSSPTPCETWEEILGTKTQRKTPVLHSA